jgi:hypothetical protein
MILKPSFVIVQRQPEDPNPLRVGGGRKKQSFVARIHWEDSQLAPLGVAAASLEDHELPCC